MDYKLLDFQHNNFLRHFINDVYVINTASDGCIYSTAPNGIIGLSLILKGQSQIFDGKGWTNSPVANVYGLIQKPQLIKIGSHFSEIAIGFKPYFLQLLISESMEVVVDNPNADAYCFFKKSALNQLFEAIYASTTENQIILAIAAFIKQHIDEEKIDDRLLTATELICQKEVYNVDKVASAINVSSVTLRNMFRHNIGLSPKEFIRLNRIRKALGATDSQKLTSLALELGYFDQSHFIHEFKNCFGLTPKQYFSNKTLVFDFYNFGRWNGDSFGLSNL